MHVAEHAVRSGRVPTVRELPSSAGSFRLGVDRASKSPVDANSNAPLHMRLTHHTYIEFSYSDRRSKRDSCHTAAGTTMGAAELLCRPRFAGLGRDAASASRQRPVRWVQSVASNGDASTSAGAAMAYKEERTASRYGEVHLSVANRQLRCGCALARDFTAYHHIDAGALQRRKACGVSSRSFRHGLSVASLKQCRESKEWAVPINAPVGPDSKRLA